MSSWRLLLAAMAVTVLLGGCDLRRETPPPTPRSADAVEQARQRAAVESRELVALADASDPAAGADFRPALATIGAHASAQLTELGGVYVDPGATPTGTPSGATPTGTPSGATPAGTPGAATPTAVSPAALVARLDQSYAATRSAAVAATDGKLARLLASISADRIIQARQLAQRASLAMPPLTTSEVPSALPSELATSAAVDLVAAEDEAGFAWEVSAALRTGTERQSALARAAIHRVRAQAWAEAAKVAATAQDPRRVAYTIDRVAAAARLPADVETALAARYSSLVATVGPAGRAVMVDDLADCAATARVWGAPQTAFPGLPERPADSSPTP
jgi:hypothetical protein